MSDTLAIYRCEICGYLSEIEDDRHDSNTEDSLYCEGMSTKLLASINDDDTMESIQDKFETRMNERVDILVAKRLKELETPPETLEDAAERTRAAIINNRPAGNSNLGSINQALKDMWTPALAEQLNETSITTSNYSRGVQKKVWNNKTKPPPHQTRAPKTKTADIDPLPIGSMDEWEATMKRYMNEVHDELQFELRR